MATPTDPQAIVKLLESLTQQLNSVAETVNDAMVKVDRLRAIIKSDGTSDLPISRVSAAAKDAYNAYHWVISTQSGGRSLTYKEIHEILIDPSIPKPKPPRWRKIPKTTTTFSHQVRAWYRAHGKPPPKNRRRG